MIRIFVTVFRYDYGLRNEWFILIHPYFQCAIKRRFCRSYVKIVPNPKKICCPMYFECVPDIKKQKIDGRQMGKLGDTIESINYGLDLFLFLCRCRLNSYSPVFRTIKIINFNLKKICDIFRNMFRQFFCHLQKQNNVCNCKESFKLT